METKWKIAGIILAAALVAGSVVYALFGNQLFGQAGSVGLAVEVFYSDGSKQMYDTGLSTAKLQIIDPNSNKVVQKVIVYVKAKLEVSGDLRHWDVEQSSLVASAYAQGTYVGGDSTEIRGIGGDTWTTGEIKELGQVEYRSDRIQSWLDADGTYMITWEYAGTITVQFPGSTQDTATGTASATWTCKAGNGVSSIISYQIEVSTSPLY